MVIKYSKDWDKLATLDIKYESLTLTEFIARVREKVPSNIKDEDILLEFEAFEQSDYNLFGEKYYQLSSELIISVKK